MKDISVIGIGHAFNYQYNAIKNYTNNITLYDNDINKIKNYNAKNNYQEITTDLVLISTPPNTHYKITNDLLNKNKKIILEKPLVTNIYELNKLNNNKNINNLYSSLHFSFGLEIDYFIKNINKRPKKIYAYISDNYVKDNHIRKDKINMCGSYLDEAINPLSAITRMFGYNIKFISIEKKYYKNDIYDYYSLSHFLLGDINIDIEVLWDNKKSQKYIDLIYDEYTIRLDSMNQEVIILENNKVLFKGTGNRMTNHYLGVLNDYINNGTNIDKSILLHKELLKEGNL